jgi:hypothetical protein
MKIMSKVNSDNHGILYLTASCNECSWESSWGGVGSILTQAQIRNNAKAHVKKTGHNVTVETGSAITYSLDD